jgi:hypothetical protein
MTDDDFLNDSPEENDLLLRLAALPRDAEPARDLWPGIAARLAVEPPTAAPETRRRPRLRLLLQTAAAVLLFTGGVAVGRHWDDRGGRPVPPAVRPVRDSLAPAVEVQRTGTEYVAALRSLAERPGTPATQAQGREAALSVLYGAAHELVRLSPDDAGVSQILKTVSVTRSGGRSTVRTVHF